MLQSGNAPSVPFDGLGGARVRPTDELGGDDESRLFAPKKPVKAIAFSIILCVFGWILIIVGLSLRSSGSDSWIAPTAIGGVCALPGTYSVVIVVGAARGWRGYKYSDLPSALD